MARIDATLRDARQRIDSADAEVLLAHALGRSRAWLYAHADDELDDDALQRFRGWLARRQAGEPVAYLIGHRGFWRFDLKVSPATLIPRADTECLVELALARLSTDTPTRVLDLGTGSGAIALSIATERPAARVLATDASGDALSVARANAKALGVANVAFRQGDWLCAVAGGRFDLIASNPPYIADGDAHLVQGDLRHEPRSALASGVDGLDAIRTISRDAPAFLEPGGWLLIEHGWEQGEAVRSLLTGAGLVDVHTAQDLEQRDRVTLGRRPG
ncbi:peptide chain release factor N(5)-glutamine methyltransferase [Lysobacter sp. A3-1-A15]|uniref:peptide chain release factor N(5)-glutamine methyltransferase n=1 Tax=Novilysobacter viscosus TaxID=3098602 RepID=UPI002ED92DA0